MRYVRKTTNSARTLHKQYVREGEDKLLIASTNFIGNPTIRCNVSNTEPDSDMMACKHAHNVEINKIVRSGKFVNMYPQM